MNPAPPAPSAPVRARRVRRALVASLVLGAIATTGCGSDSDPDADTAPTAPAAGGTATDTATDTTTMPTDTESASAPDDTTTPASEPDPDAASAPIEIEASRYGVDEITVGVGETVTFVNNDPIDHTVTSTEESAEPFDSGRFGQDEQFEIAFDDVGSYDFFCEIHPTMRATVIVE